jgi:hypothetical protein
MFSAAEMQARLRNKEPQVKQIPSDFLGNSYWAPHNNMEIR